MILMKAITVEQSRTASREYLISVLQDSKVIMRRHSVGIDPAGAAASALASAMGYVGAYIIIAPEDVIKHIPIELRSNTVNQ